MRTEELNDLLDSSFKAEPEYRLPTDFAQRVTLSLVKKEQWKSDLMDYFYLIGCVALLLVVATGIYYFADKAFLLRIVTFLKSNIIQVLFVVLILNFILLADKVLLGLLFNRWKTNQ